MTDIFSRYIIVKVIESYTTNNFIKIFKEKRIPILDKPKILLSDNVTQFRSNELKSFTIKLI